MILLGAGWFTRLRLVLLFWQVLIMEPTMCKHLTAYVFLCHCNCYNPSVKIVKTLSLFEVKAAAEEKELK